MKKNIIVALLAVITIVFFLWYDSRSRRSVETNALNDLHLKMAGVVTHVDLPTGYNGNGIISLILSNSNIDNYDPRERLKYYFCLIKGKRAELYTGAYGILVGDSVYVNTTERRIRVGRKGKLVMDGSINISSNLGFYNMSKNTIKISNSIIMYFDRLLLTTGCLLIIGGFLNCQIVTKKHIVGKWIGNDIEKGTLMVTFAPDSLVTFSMSLYDSSVVSSTSTYRVKKLNSYSVLQITSEGAGLPSFEISIIKMPGRDTLKLQGIKKFSKIFSPDFPDDSQLAASLRWQEESVKNTIVLIRQSSPKR